ncbi:MAG: hypothetical protein ABIA63_05350 [bacterium]
MAKVKFGIFSGYDPRPWIMKDCAEKDTKVLEGLIRILLKIKDVEIVYPGKLLKGYEKLCYTTELCNKYAREFARHGLAGIINVHQTWTFPQLSQKVITSYRNILRAKDASFSPRVLLASNQDTAVPGMVSGMAAAGALAQNGISFTHVYGNFNNPSFLNRIKEVLTIFAKRRLAENKIRKIINSLQNLHTLEFGSFSLHMPTTRINQEELAARWGITSENLDQQIFLNRAFTMFEWKGPPGKSPIRKIINRYVRKVVENVYDQWPEKFCAVKGRHVSRDKFALQAAIYLAVKQIAEEKGAEAVTIKCQDECSGEYATCCLATSYVGNNTDMLGKRKKPIAASCEADLPTMYSQYLLQQISGRPSGFGDFRYIKTNGRLYMAATVMNTIGVPVSRHNKYNKAWPIIEGHVPVRDDVLAREWPSNHLGFVYGDHIADIIELSERLGIGYKIWDHKGNAYSKSA